MNRADDIGNADKGSQLTARQKLSGRFNEWPCPDGEYGMILLGERCSIQWIEDYAVAQYTRLFAVLPDARIVLNGPVTRESLSDAQGAFAVDVLNLRNVRA
jgi:hypothetical protein